MRLLDRYLLRELLIPLGYCLCGFLIFYVAFDLIASLNHFQEQNLLARDVVQYYLVKLPDIIVFILPVTLLLALLYTLTNLSRHHEITAIRAAGVSLWRLSLPYLLVGFLFSGIVFVLNEFWVPDSQDKQEAIMQRRKFDGAESPPSPLARQKASQDITGALATRPELRPSALGFHNTRDGRNWIIGSYNFKTDVMTDPQVYWSSHGTNFHLVAKHADHTNDVWTFHDVNLFIGTDRQITNELAMPQFTEQPREFDNEARFAKRFQNKLSADGAKIPIFEIIDYLSVHPDLSPKYERWLRTQLHGRIAAPWSCLVVVLIAIPFGAASGRRNVFMGVAGSIVICFVYFILLQLGLALGTGGLLPAWIAAWLPNAFFGITGICLILRVR
ncbi:MAG TPA: LptF/LptG family permease [Verrucomicrobiae bacterium]|jgi:lipopolysaccharide export system permease protein|nr:LptF/LptG family permease [Verrucomicrobiae bacterium]